MAHQSKGSIRDTLKWWGSYNHGDTVYLQTEENDLTALRVLYDNIVWLERSRIFNTTIDGQEVVYTFYESSLYSLEFVHPINGGWVINSGHWSGNYREGDTITTITNNNWEMEWEIIGNRMFAVERPDH